MRLLRLVGPSKDGASLLLESADGNEQFTLPINERLRNVSNSDLPRLPLPESGPGSPPTPREIQTRIRAGASAQQLADEAGISIDRVMRFAFPVLAERTRVVDEARRARARSSHEGQLVDFGNLIDARLTRHGLDPAGVSWDAYRREDGGWTVTAALTAHEQRLQAKFSFALMNRTVSALDALAADLLSDRPVAVLLPPMPTPVVAEPAPEPAGPAPLRLAAVPDRTEPPAESNGALTTSAVRPGRRQKARTRPIPIDNDDELFDQDAFDSAPDQAAAAHPTDLSWDEPALPLDLAELGDDPAPDTDPEPRKRGRRGDKPRMPSWDDILLGVRHKSD
ncbi:MAG: septation protein SepH [Jatrophihabitantaceae bacterium]